MCLCGLELVSLRPRLQHKYPQTFPDCVCFSQTISTDSPLVHLHVDAQGPPSRNNSDWANRFGQHTHAHAVLTRSLKYIGSCMQLSHTPSSLRHRWIVLMRNAFHTVGVESAALPRILSAQNENAYNCTHVTRSNARAGTNTHVHCGLHRIGANQLAAFVVVDAAIANDARTPHVIPCGDRAR